MSILGCTDIILELGNIRCPVRALVAEINLDVILGIDFMQSHEVTIETMEPGIQRIGLGLIEPSERFQVLGNGFVARSLVYAQEIVPVRLVNFSKETQTYYPGTNVATISKVDRVEEKSTKLKYGDTLPEHMKDMYARASEGMTDGNKLKIMDLLKKYSHIFSKDDHDLGRTEQCKDSDLTEVRNWVQDGKKPWFKNIGSASYQVKSLWNQFEMLEIHDKLLVRKWDDKMTKVLVRFYTR
ncbi:hypothetical protein MAR_025201 [Mya arenaria]|uniref:Uncharacterized protein n=2 Tax=Mya arenaria TaxID=6604 RepID=A0ABY7DXH9_MYAAR|nr:hypothetical protein MAR_025201 [Mya arenaria]